MWVLFSLFFSNPYLCLSDSLFPLLHLAVLFYTYPCCVPYFILDSLMLVYFPSLFLLSSPESRISLSSFSIRNSCPLSHHHRHCKILFFFFNCFLVNFLLTVSLEAGRNAHGVLFSLPPLPDIFCFTSSLHMLLLIWGVSWSNFPFFCHLPQQWPAAKGSLVSAVEQAATIQELGRKIKKWTLHQHFTHQENWEPGQEHSASPGYKWEEGNEKISNWH